MAADYTQMVGFSQFGEPLISTQLSYNLEFFCNWALLEKGAFYNVRMPTSGAWGGDFSRLRPVNDPRSTDGKVWESPRGQWVWESGLSYSTQPIQVSGVWYNTSGTSPLAFLPLSSGVLVNYELGQITLPSAINPSSYVFAEYSFRAVPFTSVDTPWFRRIFENAMRVDSDHYLGIPSGDYKTPAIHRMSLPAVGIEVGAKTVKTGDQIGGGQVWYKNVIFHVIAETAYDRNQISDMLSLQHEKTIRMFDVRLAPYPLDSNSSINRLSPPSGAMTYPDLVRGQDQSGYFYKRLRFSEIDAAEINNYANGIYGAAVLAKTEIYMDELV